MADVPEKLIALKKAYSRLFQTDDGKVVMEDLRKVTFVNSSTLDMTPHIMSANEGMRAVMLHIEQRMRLEHLMKAISEEEGNA